MNILIVDDDSYVIEALQKGMDWTSLKIENVYTAYNVNNAKKILESVPIHIMLCDIEMPKENGLSLLRWVREKGLILQNIFLTSYEEFEYASQAIELQAFRYALKPISYEKLYEIIRQALEKEKEALKAADYQKGYKFWVDSVKNRKNIFWRKLLQEKSLNSVADIKNALKEVDISYETEDKFLCMTFELFQYKKVLAEIGNGMLGWIFENICHEIFEEDNIQIEGILRIEKIGWLLVLKVTGEDIYQSVKKKAFHLLQKTNQHFHSAIRCGIGSVCILVQSEDNLKHLRKICEDSVFSENQVLLLSEYEHRNIIYIPPNLQLWEMLLTDYNGEALIKTINKYLDGLLAERKANKECLYQFMIDCIQMIFSVLKAKHITLQSTQYEHFNGTVTEEAIVSIASMRRYLKAAVEIAVNSLKQKEESKSVVETVRDYITYNIDKEMTRESLAELVYLHPDYLARLFKKETGESLVNYITNNRIRLAKEYLEKTSDPINVIAMKVGYDNFSYFSKVFKDVTGITPKEYKNQLEVAAK